MSKSLIESTTLVEATVASDAGAGVLEVEFITPGWGSSGYYSREVVEAAAPLFAVGTHMYLDHPSASDAADRPERSVRDLAAVITEAGTVNASTGGVRGKVKVAAPYRELLTDEEFVKNIGVSIRGSATDIVIGEAEGRTGPIIEGLADVQSVDFVTRAGRGGRVLAVLESARRSAVHEATASDRHQHLQTSVRAEYAPHGTGTWAWVRDHDADERVVWFDVSPESGPTKTYQQTYDVAANDVDITLTGEPIEVRGVTKYVPVARPGSTTDNTTEESEEDTMPNIEEARLRELEEASGRVPTLESERDTAVAERDQARSELAEHRRTSRAREVIAERAREAGVTFSPLEERGLLANLPVGEDGALDEAAFTTSVNEAAAEVAESHGAGRVRGFGNTTHNGDGDQQVSETDIDTAVAGTFGRSTIKEA